MTTEKIREIANCAAGLIFLVLSIGMFCTFMMMYTENQRLQEMYGMEPSRKELQLPENIEVLELEPASGTNVVVLDHRPAWFPTKADEHQVIIRDGEVWTLKLIRVERDGELYHVPDQEYVPDDANRSS